MIIEIKYRDKTEWVTAATGDQISWTSYSKKYKKERIQPFYVTPDIIRDTWNAKEHDVQHVSWVSYWFEIFLKESEIDFLRQIKSCSDIKIIQYAKTDAGLVINNSYENIDLSNPDYFEIAETERVADTTGWKTSIKFRTNRTTINKSLPIDYTNRIALSTGQSNWIISETVISIPGKIDSFDAFSIVSFSSSSIQKYKKTPSGWVTEGNNKVVLGFGSNQDVTVLADNSIAIIGDGLGNIARYDFDGLNWNLVGNITNLPGAYDDPHITALSSSRVAIYDNLYGNLAAVDFDGTDWAIAGTPLAVVSSSGYVQKMTASKVAFWDAGVSLKDYDFDGANWTLNDTFALVGTGLGDICRMADDRVAIYGNTSEEISSYTLSGTWSVDTGTTNVGGTNGGLAFIASNEVYLRTASFSGILGYGQKSYYTDFEVLEWDLPVQDINYQWKGQTDLIIQSVSKTGNEILMYFTETDYTNFIEDLKKYKQIVINNTVTISELQYESQLIGDDLFKVIVRGVSGKIVTYKGDPVDNTYSFVVNSITYYTDFNPEEGVPESQNVFVDWYDGSRKLAQSVYKKTLSMLLFFNDVDGQGFEQNFYTGQTKNLNGNTTQDCELVIAPVAEDYYAYIVTGVIQNSVTSHNLSPGNTYNITIAGTPYYTDYQPRLISEAPDINTVENQTGINTSTKSITKQVKQYKFYLNETNAFALKAAFETRGTVKTADGATIYEERDVPIGDPIGVDLYEVVVNCLLSVTDA